MSGEPHNNNNDAAVRTVPALLVRNFALNDKMIEYALAEIADAEWAQRHGEANSAYWILGHLAWARREIARMAGCEVAKEGWEAAFTMGAEASGVEAEQTVSPQDLMADFVATGKLLQEQLPRLDDAQLAADAPFGSPGGHKDLASVLGFLHFHESYHIGQLGMIRRLLGKPRFA